MEIIKVFIQSIVGRLKEINDRSRGYIERHKGHRLRDRKKEKDTNRKNRKKQ